MKRFACEVHFDIWSGPCSCMGLWIIPVSAICSSQLSLKQMLQVRNFKNRIGQKPTNPSGSPAHPERGKIAGFAHCAMGLRHRNLSNIANILKQLKDLLSH